MKRIAKTILLAAMIAILPTLSQAQTNFSQWTKLAEEGYITKEMAATAIEKEEIEKSENSRRALELNSEEQKRRFELEKYENFYQGMTAIVGCITIIGGIVLVAMLAFRNQRRKDEQEKEMLDKLIEKGVFTQGEPVSLEFFNAQKSITTAKNYITDATMIGVGMAFVFSNTNWTDIISLAANILLWVGVLRLTVRTAIALAKFMKEKKVNNKVKNSSAETAITPTGNQETAEGVKH